MCDVPSPNSFRRNSVQTSQTNSVNQSSNSGTIHGNSVGNTNVSAGDNAVQILSAIFNANTDESDRRKSEEKLKIWNGMVTKFRNVYKVETNCIIPFEWLPKLISIEDYFVNLELQELNKYQKLIPKGAIEIYKMLEETIRTSRTLIQADGGFGKTTLLGKLAWDWAQGKNNYFHGIELVVLYKLRKHKTDDLEKDIIDFCLKKCSTQNRELLKSILKDHAAQILLLLDGLDEIEDQKEVLSLINSDGEGDLSFIRNCKIVLTTRPLEPYQEHFRDFEKVVKIVGLSEENQKTFIDRYFKNKTKSTSLMRKVKSADVEYLTNISPLMLCIICYLEEEEELEGDKINGADLIEKIITYLCEKCNERENLSLNEKQMKDAFFKMGRLCFEKKTFIYSEREIKSEIEDEK